MSFSVALSSRGLQTLHNTKHQWTNSISNICPDAAYPPSQHRNGTDFTILRGVDQLDHPPPPRSLRNRGGGGGCDKGITNTQWAHLPCNAAFTNHLTEHTINTHHALMSTGRNAPTAGILHHYLGQVVTGDYQRTEFTFYDTLSWDRIHQTECHESYTALRGQKWRFQRSRHARQ